MDDRTLFLQLVWDEEAAGYRKVLSRIPEGSTYGRIPNRGPHERSPG